MAGWLEASAASGAIRADVTATELAEAIAGLTLIALLTRAGELDDAWVDRTTTLLLKGIRKGTTE
jgi:hypothetical protein